MLLYNGAKGYVQWHRPIPYFPLVLPFFLVRSQLRQCKEVAPWSVPCGVAKIFEQGAKRGSRATGGGGGWGVFPSPFSTVGRFLKNLSKWHYFFLHYTWQAFFFALYMVGYVQWHRPIPYSPLPLFELADQRGGDAADPCVFQQRQCQWCSHGFVQGQSEGAKRPIGWRVGGGGGDFLNVYLNGMFAHQRQVMFSGIDQPFCPSFLLLFRFVFALRCTGGMATLLLPLGKCPFPQHSLKRGMFHLEKDISY